MLLTIQQHTHRDQTRNSTQLSIIDITRVLFPVLWEEERDLEVTQMHQSWHKLQLPKYLK